MKTNGLSENFLEFKKMLQDEYSKRRSVNESYSLRAFSKSLGIHSACLSALLNGKRPFTSNMIRRIGSELGMGPDEIAIYIRPSHKQTETERISIDRFSMISQWYYDAILEICQVSGFTGDRLWIAKALGVATVEVNAAIERLVEYGFLKIENDCWKVLKPISDCHVDEFTSVALKNFQEKALDMSKKALKTVELNRRVHSTLTMSLNSSEIPALREKLRSIRNEIRAEKSSTKFDDVYQLNISLYPVTGLQNK